MKRITRLEAIKIAMETLKQAEKERDDYAEKEARLCSDEVEE